MHIPVLQKEVIEYLAPKPNKDFIDATLGQGGHALSILEKTFPKGRVLGIDWDPEESSKLKIKERLIITCDNFVNLKEIVKKERIKNISGILLDLGMSSWHLEESKRGFSFLKNEPLDMRYSPENPNSAEKILNYGSFLEIEKILREFGEERFSEEIAGEIIKYRKFRPVKTTFQLAEIIKAALPSWRLKNKIDQATQTFQALRIAVNDELSNLEKVLPQALDILEKEGRLVVISFHSLEDRIVKNFFKEKSEENLIKILTKKPVLPAREEIKINPRSRSAKLRAAVKI